MMSVPADLRLDQKVEASVLNHRARVPTPLITDFTERCRSDTHLRGGGVLNMRIDLRSSDPSWENVTANRAGAR